MTPSLIALVALVALNSAVLGGGLGLVYVARCIDPEGSVTAILEAMVATAALTLGLSLAALCGWIPGLSSRISGGAALAVWAVAMGIGLAIRFATRSRWGARRRLSTIR